MGRVMDGLIAWSIHRPGVVLLAALFAVLVGALRAVIVALNRRSGTDADAELVTSQTT